VSLRVIDGPLQCIVALEGNGRLGLGDVRRRRYQILRCLRRSVSHRLSVQLIDNAGFLRKNLN